MSPVCRWALRWLTVIAVLALGACATPLPPPSAPDTLFWSGRMALKIDSTPPQSISAGFELKSQQQSGELRLLSPLGNTLAHLQWTPDQARLTQGGQVWRDASLDALLIQLTGTTLPMAALIDWLQARPTQVEGWRADLSQMGSGQLWVQSWPSSPPNRAANGATAAQPQVTLRLIVEP